MEPYIGQIMLWAGTYAPRGWAFCDGALLSIAEYQTLYTLIGTYYGGDGRTNFALPDLRGRAAIGFGQGPGLSPRNLGNQLGEEYNILESSQLPPHSHTANLKGTSTSADTSDPDGAALASGGKDDEYANADTDLYMHQDSIEIPPSGGNSTPVNNMQPCLALNYVIALTGIFPPRS